MGQTHHFSTDGGGDSFRIAQHLRIGETQHAIALLDQPAIARGILRWLTIMRDAVEFHDEFVLPAEEIREIRADGHLTAELRTELRAGKVSPQQAWPRFSGNGRVMCRGESIAAFVALLPTPNPSRKR